MARATGKVSFLRALRERAEDGSKPRSKRCPKEAALNNSFSSLESLSKSRSSSFSARAINPFKLAIRTSGSSFLSETCWRKIAISRKDPPSGQKPKAKKRVWGPSLFPKEISSRPLLCLRSQVIRLHLRESDGNDRGQDRYPKESPSASGPSMQKFWFPSQAWRQTYSVNLSADSMLPVLKQAPTNLA